MKIIITGSNSQLAGQLKKIAESKNYRFLALARKELDITDANKVSETVEDFKPDYVINCAAYNNVEEAEINSKEATEVNGEGVKNLAVSCNKTGSALVHFSTDYVFSGEKRQPYSIKDKPDPVNSYGKSKLLGENYIPENTHKYFIIRTSWIFGEGNNSFASSILKWASEKDSLKVADDQISSPTYAKDLANATVKLMLQNSYGLYHITGSGFCSRYDWCSYLLEKANWKGILERAKRSDFNSTARRPSFTALDNFPLTEITGLKMPSWQDATDRFLREKL